MGAGHPLGAFQFDNGEETVSRNKQQKKYTKHRKQKSPWPAILVAVGGLLLILGVFFASSKSVKPKAAIEVTGSPSLKVDKKEVDLGDVKLSQTVQVSFQLTNVGDQTLQFTKEPYVEVKEGC